MSPSSVTRARHSRPGQPLLTMSVAMVWSTTSQGGWSRASLT